MSLNVYRAITYISGGTFGTAFLHFLMTPILIRFLGSGYGDYAFVMSMLAIATYFLASLGDGIQKFIAERLDEQAWRGEVFGFFIRLSAGIGIVFVLGLVGAIELGFVARRFGKSFETYFYLLGLMIVARVFFMSSRDVLIGVGAEHISEAIYTLHRLLFSVFGVGMAVLGFGVTGVLLGDVVATTLVMAVGLGFVSRRVQLSGVFSRTPESFPSQNILRFSSQIVILGLLFQSVRHVDILLLRPIAGAQATAHYKAALVVAEFVWVLPMALQHSLVHISSSMWANDQYDALDQLASRITRYNLLLLLLIVLGLAVLADTFIKVYFGIDYLASTMPLLILLPGVLGYALTLPLLSIGKGKGDLRLLIYATAAGAVLNLVFNLVLIPLYGMLGAAVATSIGYASMLLFHLFSSRRIDYDPLCDLRLGRIGLTVVLSSPVIYGLDIVVENSLSKLLLIPPSGFVVYAAIAFWLGALGRSEVDDILEQIPIPFPTALRRLFQT